MKELPVVLIVFTMASGVLGSPVVDNAGYTPEVGYATLSGDLVSTGSAPATVHIYWSTNDGGTNAGDWAHTNILGGPLDQGGFSSDTDTGLIYGVEYHFRCYASNVNGEAWATTTATFVTAPPETVVPGNGLSAYGYHINNDGLALNLHNNGGMMGGGDPTTFQNFHGHSILTSGPGDRGLDFDNDGDFKNAGLVNQDNNYSTLFTGHFIPPLTGDYGFRNAGDDDRAGIWLDLDRDGVFESSPTGLGDNRGEQLCWESTSWKTHTLTAGLKYRIAFTHREGGGGSRCEFHFQGAGMIARVINPAHPLQDGMWQCPCAFANPEIDNLAVSPDLTSSSATFKGVVNYAPDALFDVTVYWGTSDGGAAAGSWAHTNFVGSFTNVPTIDLSFYTDTLAGDTRYYYTFVARNAATNLWAAPSTTFQTLGAPTVDNGAGPASHVGFARLNGEVTIGGQTDVTICWGRADAGTGSILDWDHAVSMGTIASEIPFSTDVTNAWYGLDYVYRCYATNAHGDDWSDAADFSILREWLGTNALRHTGYHGHSNENYMNLDNNGGLMALTPVGTTTLTLGPGNRGLDFNSDAEFIAAGAVSHTDNYANLFVGYFTPPETGTYRFDIQQDDDRSGIWLDLDRDGVFESRAPGLASDNGEQLAWEDQTEKYVDLEAGRDYMFAVTHREGGGGSGIHARFRLPSGAYPNIKPGDPAQAGMWSYPIEPSLRLTLENTSVSNVTAGAAYLNATLYAPLQRYDVRVYWGRSDHGTNKSAWIADGGGAMVGSYTNVSGARLTCRTTGLDLTTNYYYTFYASNAVEDIWAQPAVQFETFGVPTVTNTGATITQFDGRATLNGALTSGGNADIYVCWGSENAGSGDTSAWEHVVSVGTETTLAPFSTRIDGMLYGVPYYYTCFATNSAGSGWSAVTNFITGKGTLFANALRHYGYHVSAQGDMDLNNNGGMMNGGDPATFPGFYAQVLLTDGPGGRGLDFNGDGDFVNAGAVTKYDQYENLFLGYLYAFEDGEYQFRRASDDDQIGIWLDIDRDGVFESSPAGLGSNRGEQLQWDGDAGTKILTLSAGYYMFAATHREGTGGSNIDVQFMAPSMDALISIRPTTDPAQAGMWHYDSELNVGITNSGVSGLIAGQADLNGVLYGELAAYDVWVYWSTNNGGESKSAWLAGGGTNVHIGSFTNVASTSLVHTITGLPPATTYFYTYYASNAAEEIWGTPSVHFNAMGPPSVTNSGADDIGVGCATLRGELTSGGAADVAICWGESDAGTNSGTGAWEHVEPLGQQLELQVFGADISGTRYGVEYEYRVFVSNTLGTSWSDVAAFTTLVPRGSWSPAETGVGLWLDAADAGTITHNGGAVSRWADKSGNGRDATQQGVPGSQPADTADGLNGKHVLTFDGVNDYLNVDLDFLAGQSHSAFIVTKVTAYTNIYGAATGGRGNQSLHVGFIDTARYRMNYWGHDWYGTISPRFHAGQFNTLNYVWPVGSPKEIYANGSLEGTSGGQNAVAPATMAGGGRIASVVEQGHFGGDIAEILMRTGALSVDERQLFEGYLAHKWGLEGNLPEGHPYKESFDGSGAMLVGITNTGAANVTRTTADLIGVLDATQSVFEVSLYWSTNDNADAAAWVADGAASQLALGTHTNVMAHSITGSIGSLVGGVTYYYTMVASNAVTNMWATPNVSFEADHAPPSPSPMTFAHAPTALEADTIVMTASAAADPAVPVEYTFENMSNSNVRAWSTSRAWTNDGLVEGRTYAYRVKARDALGNETEWSAEETAVAENDNTPPTPSPMTFAAAPAPVHATAIAMTATMAHDVNAPVEYFFENTTSGRFRDWDTSPDWTNTGLTRGDAYGYRVKARDAMGNETAWSAVVNATAAPVKIPVAFYVYDGTGQGAQPSAFNPNYLDPGNVELTDSVVPATTAADQAPWVGYRDDLPDDVSSQPRVTFDFGRDRRVESIEVTYLHSTSQAGGTITAPESVLVSVSGDGVTYSTPVSFSAEFDSSAGDAIRMATLDVTELPEARYYRLDFRNTSQWAFFAEVTFWTAPPPRPPGTLILVR